MLPLMTHYLLIVPDQNGKQSFPEIFVGNFPFCQNRLIWLKDVWFNERAQSLRKRFCADIFMQGGFMVIRFGHGHKTFPHVCAVCNDFRFQLLHFVWGSRRGDR